MEKKTVLTDDWESDLAAIIEKTNQNLNLLRKIGEKREDAPAKKAMAMMSRAKSSNALGTAREPTASNDRTRASIATDASIHKWKQVLDDSTTLKRHIAHKMLESTKAKDKDKGPRRAASSAWEAPSTVNTNQDDREARAAHQPLLSLDEIKKSLQVDIASRASLLEKQIADLRTDYQTIAGESGAASLKLQQLSTQLEAKANHVSSVEHTLQEQSAILGRLDVQANHVLKWKAAVDVDLQTQTAKAALVDGLEKKVVSLERTVAELVTRLAKASDVEQSIEHCTLRISQLEAKAAKSFDTATLTHTIETVVTKAMQAYDDRLTRRLEALTDMQETKNASFLKTIQGQRENYEKAIQYALEASVGDLRNEVDAHTKRTDTRSQDMATSLDLRLTALAKRVATVETKSSGIESDVDATKNASERDELLKKAVLRHIADTYVSKQQVTTLLVDELEARGTISAWKRLETSVSKMYREFDQKWHDATKWVDDLKLQVEKTSAGLLTMQSSVQKSHVTETQALRAKLLQCVNELDQLQSTKLDMDAHFARLEKDRDMQIQKLQSRVSEAEAKRDADVLALQNALQSKLLQIASTSGQVEVMKALWKHEQSTLRVCKSDLSSARHEALSYKLKLQSAEKDKARMALDQKQAMDRLTDQLARLQKQWQAADRDRATAQTSLHALLQDDARKRAKLATLQGVLQRLQAAAAAQPPQATASPSELEATVHEMAAQAHTIHALRANVSELEAAKKALEANLQASRVSFEAELAALQASHDSTLAAREAALTQISNALASQSAQHAHVCAVLTTMAKDVGASTEAADESALACASALQTTWAERVQHWEAVQAQAQAESAAAIETLRTQLAGAAAIHENDKVALEARMATHAIELETLLEEKVQLEAHVRTQEDAVAQLHQEYQTDGSSLEARIEALQDELASRVNDAELLRNELASATSASEATSALEEELYEARAALEAMTDATASEKAELEAKMRALEDALSTSHDDMKALGSAREEDAIQHSDAIARLETEIAARDATILALTSKKEALVLAQGTLAEVESRLAVLMAEKADSDASLAAWAAKEAELVDALTSAQATHAAYKTESALELQSLHEALHAQRSATTAMEDDLRRLVTELRLPCAESTSTLVATLQAHVAELQAALDDASDERDAIVTALDVSSLDDAPAAAAQLRQSSMDTVQDLAAAEKALALLRLELDARSNDLEATRASLARLEASAACDKAAALAALQATEAQWTAELAQSKAAVAPLELEVAAKACEVEALQSQVVVAEAALARCDSEMSWLLHEITVDVEALRGEVDTLEDATEAHMQTLLESQAAHDEQYSAIGHAQDRLEGLQSQLQTLRQQVAAVPMQLYQLQHLQSSLTTEASAVHKQRDEHEKERLRLRLLESECAANAEVAFTELTALFAAHGGDASQHAYIMKTMSHLPSLAARLQSVAATIGTMTAHATDARTYAAGDGALPTTTVADIESVANHVNADTTHGHGAAFHEAATEEDGEDDDIISDSDEDAIEECPNVNGSEATMQALAVPINRPALPTAADDTPCDMHKATHFAPDDDNDDVHDDDDDAQEESADDEPRAADIDACPSQAHVEAPKATMSAGSDSEDGTLDETPHPQHAQSASLADGTDEKEAPTTLLLGTMPTAGPASTGDITDNAEDTEIDTRVLSPEGLDVRGDDGAGDAAESDAELSDDFDAEYDEPEAATDSAVGAIHSNAVDLAPSPEYEADEGLDENATEIAAEVDNDSSDDESEQARAASSLIADQQPMLEAVEARLQDKNGDEAHATPRSAIGIAGPTPDAAHDDAIDRSGYPMSDDASDDDEPRHRFAAAAVPLAVGAATLASLRSSAGFQATTDDDDDVERLMQSRLRPALAPVRDANDDDEFAFETTDASPPHLEPSDDENDEVGSTLDESVEESFDNVTYDDEDVDAAQVADEVLGTEENASLHEPSAPTTHGPPSPESPSRSTSIHQLLFGAKTETIAGDHDVEAPIDIAMAEAPSTDSQQESAATILAESEGEDDTASGDEASFSLESTAPAAIDDDPRTPDEAVASCDALLGATASPGKYFVNADEAHDELATCSDEADETYSPNAAFLPRNDINGESDVDEMDEALSDVDESTDGRGSAEHSERSPLGPEAETEMTNHHSFEHRTDEAPSSDGWDASSSAHAVSLNDVPSATGRVDKFAYDDEALDTKDDHMITSAPRAEARMAAQDAQKDFTNSHQNEHEDDLEDDDAAVLRATMDGVANMAAAESLDEDLSSSESDADEAPMPNEVLSHTNVQPTERSVPQAADGDASDEEEVMALQQSAPMGAHVTLASLRRAVDSDDDEFDHEESLPPTAAGDDHSFNMDEETNAAGSAHDASADQVRYESRDVDTLADDNSFDMEYDDVVPPNDVDTAEDNDSSDDEGVTTTPDLQPLAAEMSQGNYRDTSDVDATSLKADQTTPLVVGGNASLAPAHDMSVADDEVGDDEAFSDDEVLSEADANEPSVEDAQTEEVEHHAPATIHAHREASKDAPSFHADASDDLDEVERLMHSHLHQETADDFGDSFDAENDASGVEAAQPPPVHVQESSELRLGNGHEETLRHADLNAAYSEPHDDSGDEMDDDGPLSDPEDDEDVESLNVSTPSPTDTDAASRIPETAAMTETETFETTAAPLGKDQAHVTADVAPLQTTHEYDDAEELSSSDGEDDMDIDESIEASEDDPSADISTGALFDPAKAAGVLISAANDNGTQLTEGADGGNDDMAVITSRLAPHETQGQDSGADTFTTTGREEDKPTVDHKDGQKNASQNADAAMETALSAAYESPSVARPGDASSESHATKQSEEQLDRHADDDHDNSFDMDEGTDDVGHLADDEERVDSGSPAVDVGTRSSMTSRFDDDEAVSDDSLEASGDDENSFDASGHTPEPPSAETHGDGIPLTSSVVDNGLSDPVSTRQLDDDQELSDADDHELSGTDDQADIGVDNTSALERDRAAGEKDQLVASVSSLHDDHTMRRVEATSDDDEALSDPEDDAAENSFDEPTEHVMSATAIDREAGAPLTELHDSGAPTSDRLRADVEALSDGEDETSVDANHREATALSKTPLDATASLDEPTLTTRPNEGARGVPVVETHVNAEDENDDSDDALSDVEDAHDTLSNRSGGADAASHLGTETRYDLTAASTPNAIATAPMHIGDDCEEALSDEESASDFDSSFDAPNPTQQSPPVEPHFHDASPMSPNDVATRDLMVEVSPPMENDGDDDDALFEANDKAYLVDDDESSFDAVVAAPLTTPHGAERYDNLTTDRHDVMHPVDASSTQFDDEDEVLSDPEDDGDAIDSSFDASAMTPDELRASSTENDANPTTDRHDATRPVVRMSTHFDDEDEALSDPEDDVDGDDGRYDAPVVTTDEPRVPSPESHDNSTTDHDDTMHPVAAASSAHYDAEDEALSDAEDDVNAIDGSIGAPVATSDELRVSPTENHANSTAGHHEAMRPVDQPSSHFDDEDEALSDPEGDVDGIDNSFDAPATMASEPLVASAKSYVNSTVHRHEAARPVVQTPPHFDDEDEALSGGEDEADGIDNSFDAPATMVTRGEPRVPSTESHNYPTTDRHDAMRPVDQPSAHFDDEDEALSGAEDEVDGIDNSFDAPMVTKSEPRVSPTESHVNRTTDLNDAMRPVAASSTHFDDADEALSDADDQDLLDTKDDGNAIDSSFDAPMMPQHELRTSSTDITDGTDSNGRVIDDRVPSLVVERNTIDDDGGYEALSDPDDESFGDVEHGSNGLSEAPARPTFAVDDPVDADALSDDESGVGAPSSFSMHGEHAYKYGEDTHASDNDHHVPVAAPSAMAIAPREAESSVPLASSRPSNTSFDDASDVDDDDDDGVTAPLQGADAASIDAASRRLLTTAHFDDADDLSSESDDEPPAAPAQSHPVYDDGGEDVSDSDADDTTDVTSTPLAQTPPTTNESAPPVRSSAMEDDEDEDEVETPLPSRAPTGGLVASRFGTMANAPEADDEDLDEVERLMQGHLQGRATDNSFDFDDGEDVENSFDAPDNTTTVSHARSANEEDDLSDSEDHPPTANVPNHHGSLGHETGPASQPTTASVVSSSVPPPTAQHPTHPTDEQVELDDSDEELSTKRNEPVPRHAPQAAPLRSIASQLPPVASTLGRHAPLGAKAPLAALHAGDTEDDLDEVERLMRDHVTTHASLASRTAADADFDDSFDAQEASGDDDDDNDDALSDPDEATAAFNAVTQREDTLAAGKRMPLAPLTKPLPPIGASQESSFDDASPSKLSALDRALLPSGDALHIHTVRHHDDDAMELGASFDDGNEDSLDASGVADPPRFDDGEDVDGSSRDDQAASFSPSPVTQPSSALPHDDDDAYSDSFDMEESIDESVASDEDATS